METAFGTEVRPLYYTEAEYNKARQPQSQAATGSFAHHRGFSGKTSSEQAELLAKMQAEHKEAQVASTPASVQRESFDLGDDDGDDDDDIHHDAQNLQESAPSGPPSVPSFAGPSSRFETAVAEWDFVSFRIQLQRLCTLSGRAIILLGLSEQ